MKLAQLFSTSQFCAQPPMKSMPQRALKSSKQSLMKMKTQKRCVGQSTVDFGLVIYVIYIQFQFNTCHDFVFLPVYKWYVLRLRGILNMKRLVTLKYKQRKTSTTSKKNKSIKRLRCLSTVSWNSNDWYEY